MQEYARAIEEISITNVGRHRSALAQTAPIRLAQLQGATPLFPRLDRLSIREKSSVLSRGISYHVLPMFLSPALTSLSITGVGGSRRASAVVSFLGMLGPQKTVSKLSLGGFSLSPALVKAIVSCGEVNWLELTDVTGTINQPSLHTLFSMPSLTHITFHTKILEYFASESVENLLPGSTRLSELHLTGPFTLVSEWTKYFSGRCDLQKLHMHIITTNATANQTANKILKQKPTQYAKPSPVAIATFIEKAIPAWQHSLLTFIMVIDYAFHHYALPPTLLDAFSGYTLLETLTITIPLHDTNLALQKNMAHWPSLTYLHLPRSNLDCTVSMETLHHLAEHCPCLASLRILIQGPEDDPFSDIASQGVHFPRVHTLSVGTWPADFGSADPPSSVQDPDQAHTTSVEQLCSIARNLLRVFPSLHTFETQKLLSEKRWGRIKALVDLCRDAEKYSKALSN